MSADLSRWPDYWNLVGHYGSLHHKAREPLYADDTARLSKVREPSDGDHRKVRRTDEANRTVQRVRRDFDRAGKRGGGIHPRGKRVGDECGINCTPDFRCRHRRRRRGRPGGRDLHAASSPQRLRCPRRRREPSGRENSRQRRRALQRHQHDRHGRGLLGRTPHRHPACAARLSRRRHHRVLP